MVYLNQGCELVVQRVIVAMVPDPLTCVASALSVAGSPLAALPHILGSVSSYLDWSCKYTLERAAVAPFAGVHLMNRLLAQEQIGGLLSDDERRSRFQNGIRRAATQGDVAMLQWWMDVYLPGHDDVAPSIFQIAADKSYLHVVQWLFQWKAQSVAGAVLPVECNHPEIIYWLHHHQEPSQRLQIDMAVVARAGDLQFIQWVYAHDDLYQLIWMGAMDQAAMHGHVELMQWLHEQRIASVGTETLALAACYGRLDVLQWLQDEFPSKVFADPAQLMATKDHVDVVRWLLTNFSWTNPQRRDAWISAAIQSAASIGSVELLETLIEHTGALSYRSSRTAMQLAAYHGHVSMMRWLCGHNIRSTNEAMDNAAASGHLEIVRLLHEHPRYGCSTHAMDKAAAHNHLLVVEWLHDHRLEGCTKAAMDGAAANGYLSTVQWLHGNRKEGCTVAAMDEAAANGHLHVVRYLHSHRSEGCTRTAMDQAAARGHIQVVKWLAAHRTEGCSQLAVELAASNGHVEILAFLLRHYGLECDEASIAQAKRNGHFGVLEWLRRYG